MNTEDKERVNPELARISESIIAGLKPATPQQQETYEEYERRRRVEQRIEELQRTGIPKRFWHASFAYGDPSPALEYARQYIETDIRKGRCLVLAGPTGVGKTYAAVAILQECRNRSKHFFYFPALCAALLDAKRRPEELERAKNLDLAVFDDFGVEYLKSGGFLDALLDEIIWYREAEMLPTIITTNLSPEQFKERLSDRIIDRLRGDWGTIYVVPGQSRRQSLTKIDKGNLYSDTQALSGMDSDPGRLKESPVSVIREER